MTRYLTLATILALAACSQPITPAQQAAGQEAITIASALTPIAAQAVSASQLLCQGAGIVYAIIDTATGKPVQVPGQTAQFVANACALVGATPTALPAAVASVTPVAVAVPKA